MLRKALQHWSMFAEPLWERSLTPPDDHAFCPAALAKLGFHRQPALTVLAQLALVAASALKLAMAHSPIAALCSGLSKGQHLAAALVVPGRQDAERWTEVEQVPTALSRLRFGCVMAASACSCYGFAPAAGLSPLWATRVQQCALLRRQSSCSRWLRTCRSKVVRYIDKIWTGMPGSKSARDAGWFEHSHRLSWRTRGL